MGVETAVPRAAQAAIDVAARHGFWMTWNTVLALVPLGLAFVLFRPLTRSDDPDRRLGLGWWVGFGAFVVFLPNAPYVLTDVVHLLREVETGGHSETFLLGFLAPLFAIFMFIGFEAYVVSMLSLDTFLRRRGRRAWIVPSELVAAALSAVGIYIGRFLRFNSWDVWRQPGAVIDDLFAAAEIHAAFYVAVFFGVVAGLYYVLKALHVGVALGVRSMRRDS